MTHGGDLEVFDEIELLTEVLKYAFLKKCFHAFTAREMELLDASFERVSLNERREEFVCYLCTCLKIGHPAILYWTVAGFL